MEHSCDAIGSFTQMFAYAADKGAADDRAVGQSDKLMHMLGLVNAKPNADRPIRDRLELLHIRFQIRGQLVALAFGLRFPTARLSRLPSITSARIVG